MNCALLTCLALFPALASSCRSPEGGETSLAAREVTPNEAGAPAWAELQDFTFSGIEGMEGPVALSDGLWEGQPFVEGGASGPSVSLAGDFLLTGDLDADGSPESAVLLAQDSGGSGTFLYLAIVGRKAGQLQNVATTLIGDRVQVRGGRLEGGRVSLDVVQAGPEDASCCPGEVATLAWELKPGGLTAVGSSQERSRLSLETIAGTEWVLRSWDISESAPVEPEKTLLYEGGRLAGTGGCNRYFAAAQQGAMPGDLTVGPVGATRMACGEPADQVESRYLELLGKVQKFGFYFGKLALSYPKADGIGVLLFEGRPISK